MPFMSRLFLLFPVALAACASTQEAKVAAPASATAPANETARDSGTIRGDSAEALAAAAPLARVGDLLADAFAKQDRASFEAMLHPALPKAETTKVFDLFARALQPLGPRAKPTELRKLGEAKSKVGDVLVAIADVHFERGTIELHYGITEGKVSMFSIELDETFKPLLERANGGTLPAAAAD